MKKRRINDAIIIFEKVGSYDVDLDIIKDIFYMHEIIELIHEIQEEEPELNLLKIIQNLEEEFKPNFTVFSDVFIYHTHYHVENGCMPNHFCIHKKYFDEIKKIVNIINKYDNDVYKCNLDKVELYEWTDGASLYDDDLEQRYRVYLSINRAESDKEFNKRKKEKLKDEELRKKRELKELKRLEKKYKKEKQ